MKVNNEKAIKNRKKIMNMIAMDNQPILLLVIKVQ